VDYELSVANLTMLVWQVRCCRLDFMSLRKQAYYHYYSTTDRSYVCLITQRRVRLPAVLVRYYIRFQARLDEKWIDVVEYDNCHGVVHQHDYNCRGVKGPAKILGPGGEEKRTFEELQVKMARLYPKHKEWYHQR
jgi:hypothetical protein